MPTNKVAKSFIKFAIILYAFGPLANAEAAEESITGIYAIVQVPEESPVSYDPSLVDDAQFKDQVLIDHNWYRAQHGSPALKWNNTLESASQEWVAKCANGFSTSYANIDDNSRDYWGPENGYGENHRYGDKTVDDFVDGLGLTRINYDYIYVHPSMYEFARVVWADTTTIGCARQLCTQGISNISTSAIWSITCQYYPIGNRYGRWPRMIGKQLSGTPSQGIANIANQTIMIPSNGVTSNVGIDILGLAIGLMVATVSQTLGVF